MSLERGIHHAHSRPRTRDDDLGERRESRFDSGHVGGAAERDDVGTGVGCAPHARARGARIYAELVGFGMSGDAFQANLTQALKNLSMIGGLLLVVAVGSGPSAAMDHR